MLVREEENRVKKFLGMALLAASVAGFAAMNNTAQDSRAVAQEKKTGEPYRPKMALVNIAKVLKDYDKANAQGKAIADLRMGYLNKVNTLRTQLNEKNKEMAQAADAVKKEAVTKQMTELTRQIEDIDLQAQKQLGEMSNNTVVSVYKEIRETIAAIAEANGLELVMAFPDASEPKDMDSAVVAQLKLQTPALMPFYHKNIDITKYVIDTLNQRYPAPKASAGAGSPDANVRPASGTK